MHTQTNPQRAGGRWARRTRRPPWGRGAATQNRTGPQTGGEASWKGSLAPGLQGATLGSSASFPHWDQTLPPPLKPRGLLDIRLTQTRQHPLSVTGFPGRAPRSRGCMCYFTETSQQPRERTAFCISVSGC